MFAAQFALFYEAINVLTEHLEVPRHITHAHNLGKPQSIQKNREGKLRLPGAIPLREKDVREGKTVGLSFTRVAAPRGIEPRFPG